MEKLPSNLIDDSVVALATGLNKGVDVFKDGFQFQDLFQLIPTALSIQAIVENKEELLAQLKDYSLEERGKSIETLKTTLSFTGEKAEKIVGICYDAIFALVGGVIELSEGKAAVN